jgi:Lamin Tail Domain/Abnormal spindle-like microcephaly-assoc'd, ASPM-SPD-2-Hydin
MKLILPALALLTASVHGQLVITEVMAESAHVKNAPIPDADGDWWELTNTGSTSVNLTGYKWDDTPTPATPTMGSFPAGVIIQPGESIVILDEPASNVGTWRAAWGLNSTTQVIDRDRFASTGGEPFSGLGNGGDEVNLYDPTGKTVASAEFGVSNKGKSQAFHRDGMAIYGLSSTPGVHGATASALSSYEVGSPGDARLHFITAPVAHAKSSYRYLASATAPGGSAPVISATSVPPFLSLTTRADGSATLANNRPLTLADAGEYLIQLTANSNGVATTQEYFLTVLNPQPSLILNEYNAVSSQNFLNGGTALTDEDGGPASADEYFGRVAGNGGQWVEFVVLGNGGVGTLDMRGWSVEIGSNSGFGYFTRNTLVLSDHVDWSAVPSGTILTFIGRDTSQGGKDSGFNLRDYRTTTGDLWTNIWMGDSAYLTYTSSVINGYSVVGGIATGIAINNDNAQFRVKDSAGAIIFGPVGEGIASRSGTNSKEVFELEAHPTASVSPAIASTATLFGYGDGASESTFGLPNRWLSGATLLTQRFTALTAPEISVEQPIATDLADGGMTSFGRVATGTTRSLVFTIRNSGSAALGGLTITKDGMDAADFTLTTVPVTPVPAAGGASTFTVTFAPATVGSKVAAIHIASNDDDESSYDLILTGTAFTTPIIPPIPSAPEISVQQPTRTELVDGTSNNNFGKVKIGKTGRAKTFTIKNTGNAALTGLAITKNGKHSRDFIVSKPVRTTVAAGGFTTFKVTFKPTAKGARKAAIHLKSNDANENPFDISLTGAALK